MQRSAWLALSVVVSAMACLPSGPTIQPIKTALQNYFGGGYVIYSLPGTGAYYMPGAILRYQNKAEVLVWPREECFKLDIVKSVAYAPRSEWSEAIEVGLSLNMFIPPAASSLEPELKDKRIQHTNLQFGAFELQTLVEGAVIARQKSPEFPPQCREEYGKKRVLVLGTIGSGMIRFRINSSDDLSASVGTKLRALNVGGKASVRKSGTSENILEVALDQPIIMGYIPGLLVKEESVDQPRVLGGPPAEAHRIIPLSIDEAFRLREGT